jgi:glycosyltransferase involved in cell wall biosynthesis
MGVHNGLPYLPEAVESILRQTFADFEFIIVDDGSTDGSGAWLEAKAKEDPRIRLIRQENIGLTKALNRGLAMARGEFVARMDADDIALPQRFEIQVQTLRDQPDLVLLGSEVEITDEHGWPLIVRGHVAEHAEIRRRLLAGDGGALTHPAVIFRAEAARAIGGYDERMTTTQDIDFFIRLSEVGRASNVPHVLLRWRQHPESSNHRRFGTWADMRRYCIGQTIKRIGVERYLEELFPPMALGYPRDNLSRARWAADQRRYRTAAALYRQALRTSGQRLSAAQGLCEAALLEANARLWNGLKRFSSRLKAILSPR